VRVRHVTMLQEYLEQSASRYPHKTALVFRGERLSWADVHERAGRIARALQRAGVRRGDRVVLYMDNSVELATSIFGVLAADGIFSIVNAQTKADKLEYMLDDCRARVLITDRGLERFCRPALERSKHLSAALVVGQGDAGQIGAVPVLDFVQATSAERPDWPQYRNIPLDLASIIYTSGSTGNPKGVMLTHHNMVSAVESISTYLDNVHEDIVLDVLPMSFDYGLYQWLKVSGLGATLVLEVSFSYPAAVVKLIQEERVTGLPVVPTIASIFRQLQIKGLVLPGVRYVTNTAAALSVAHIETLQKLCPNAHVYSMYGLTECKRVSYLPPARLADKPTSVGIPMPNLEVMVVGPDGKSLPPGEVGELVVRGPHVMRGYWEKPDITAEWLRPGPIPGEMHLWTGDLFSMDEEGFLYFIGRKDDIIKSRGEKVSPREVENVLYQIPQVLEVLVAGRPDEVLGQAVHAFLVLAEGASLTVADVARHCAERLEGFMVPKRVSFLSSLPKTTSGKLTRKAIWEHAAGAHTGGDPV
jgi:long-chain acyl-CoA synthetase